MRVHPFHVLGLTAAFAACAVRANDNDLVRGSDDGPDTTTVTTQDQPATAMVTGKLVAERAASPQLSQLECKVNGVPQTVTVAADGSFVLRSVPSGNVVIEISAAGGASGRVELDDVQAGELLSITLRLNVDLQITADVEDRFEADDQAFDLGADATVTITENAKVIVLPAGVIQKTIVVEGDDVVIIGRGAGCQDAAHVTIQGDLIIRGDGVMVVGVSVSGRVDIQGSDARVVDDCRAAAPQQPPPQQPPPQQPPPQQPPPQQPPPQQPPPATTAEIHGRVVVDTAVVEQILRFVRQLQCTVNGSALVVALADDHSFTMQIPTGDVRVSCGLGELRGSFELHGVAAGQVLSMDLRVNVD